jgi:hypothetical protein
VRSPLKILVLAMLATLAVALVGLIVDPTQITGRPAWLKPAKFAISVAVYAATLLWLLSFVQGRRRLVRLASGRVGVGVGRLGGPGRARPRQPLQRRHAA